MGAVACNSFCPAACRGDWFSHRPNDAAQRGLYRRLYSEGFVETAHIPAPGRAAAAARAFSAGNGYLPGQIVDRTL